MNEGALARATENTFFKFIARGAMLVLPPILLWVGNTIVDRLDRLTRSYNDLSATIIRIEGSNSLLNARLDSTVILLNTRIDELSRSANSRADALSAWTRRNTDDIDKLKDSLRGRP